MSENNQAYVISDQNTADVLTIRKIEMLLDVLAALENSNAPEIYGIKISVIDKLDRLINNL